jgi:oxygen-independent coproporphyrinogen-3 oxidase
MAGIYVHIPFCKQACYYCDFHFSTNQGLQRELTEAIAQEVAWQHAYLPDRNIQTLYFGGGTPSILSSDDLSFIMDSIQRHFVVDPLAEITLEANPDDLTPEKLSTLKRLGINRLSIGVQSFHDSILSFLNRAHASLDAVNAYQAARAAGFSNIGLDLIYGIPGESPDQLRHDVHQMLALRPEHISCYSLTIEEKTVFGKWSKAGKLKPVDDDVAASHLEYIVSELEHAGYEHYEVSNFGLPSFHSRHNSSYWQQQPYLGVGPSAHSYNGQSRQFNISNNQLYVKSIKAGKIPFEQEVLSAEDQANEFLLTTLRTSRGSDLRTLREQFDYDLQQQQAEYLERLISEQLAVIENQHLILTRKGRLLADRIASDLFLISYDH